MPLIAITRAVSPNINQCELSFHDRHQIDVPTAIAQHEAYNKCLESLGAKVIALPAEPDLPDSVFVEDAAIVFDEVAVIPIMAAASRRDEPRTLVPALSRFRALEWLREPATLDGGDVVVADHRVFVGLTRRTNREAVNQLGEILRPHGYIIKGVPVRDILHLKSACCYLGNNALLINRKFTDASVFQPLDLIDVTEPEPAAANVLSVNGTVIAAASFPETCSLLEQRGFRVRRVEVAELQKAEAGVTCCSLVFSDSLSS
ncbi:MAG TPA: arginine deiminase family protein [Chthoniobacterales bacterium]|nr:arginine deiminase family protein [Chthoniobacterales bacterium]